MTAIKSSDRKTHFPLHVFDSAYFDRPGVCRIAGIDEAGRGALAGPVVVGAVVTDASARLEGVNDSKKLTPAQRERALQTVCRGALDSAIGWASAEEVDRINIYQATLLAAKRALSALRLKPDLILADALKLEVPIAPVVPLVKGDSRSQAIAAASILAKVTRDRWMGILDEEYPPYGFAQSKGYGVAAHMEALREHGPSTLHRHSFKGVDWFNLQYRHSATLRGLLDEAALEGLDREGREEIWLARGRLLPEEEYRLWIAPREAT